MIGTWRGRAGSDLPVLAVPNNTAAPNATCALIETAELMAFMSSLPRQCEINRDRDPRVQSLTAEPAWTKQRSLQRLARGHNELHMGRPQDENGRRVDTPTGVYESLQDDATFDPRSPHRFRMDRARHAHQRRKDIWNGRSRDDHTNCDEPLNGCRRRRCRRSNGGLPMESGGDEHGGNHRVQYEPLYRRGILSSRQVIVHGRLSAVGLSERYGRPVTRCLHVNYGMVTTGCDLPARQPFSKRRPPPRAALHVDRPAMRLGDPLADREAEPGTCALARARAGRVGAPEAVEDVRQIAGGDADAGVCDGEYRPPVVRTELD